jgi:hypothetical protein
MAASNTSGGSSCEGPVRTAARNGGTYAVGVGSWASPKRQPHVPPIAALAHEENPTEEDPPTAKEDQETAEEDPLFLPFEEDPSEENRTFKPPDSPHYQNGRGKRQHCDSVKANP